ncbi:MAG: chorismate mutase [Clostridia bacterium]|nr:chorismate mutase [Clostridia bacterium]
MEELRNKIDETDRELTRLFEERMKTASLIAEYKMENNLPVFDAERERKVINKVTSLVDDDFAGYTKSLYNTIFDLSRSYQNKKMNAESPLKKKMEEIIASTPLVRPERAVVACQGVEGAYSQHACDKMFKYPSIMYFPNFEDVFKAVDSGLCRYGVLPIENSNAGSVDKVYDLMGKYKFHIVHSTKLFIEHALLAKPGTALGDIKEIFSHEQAINQSSNFIKSLGVKVTICKNTAEAAKMVSLSDRNDVAAIGSKDCADLYSLKVVASAVQNSGNNYTRFILISKNLEIYPGAKKTSIMMTVAHRPGSLYNIIARFSSLGLNMTKLESRPIPGSNFEFMFYFDIDESVYNDDLKSLIAELDTVSEQFTYLGSYTED